MIFASSTHRGKIRELNEDSVYVPAPHKYKGPAFLMAVADGMGGHNAGEVASAMAIKSLLNLLQQPGAEKRAQTEPVKFLSESVAITNDKIYYLARQGEKFSGMGTTLTAALCLPECVYVAHMGDSRAYLLAHGRLQRITRDHTLVQELVQSGILTEQEAAIHPQRNIITRALGTQQSQAPDIFEQPWQRGDRLLICSDGLTNHVADEELEQYMKERHTPQQLCDLLVEQALHRGGSDNISVCVGDHQGGESA